jgi:hypothetical protein
MGKSYKNIQELKKEWEAYGVFINKKGELITNHKGKEYKIGQVNFFNENGKKVSSKEVEKESKKN